MTHEELVLAWKKANVNASAAGHALLESLNATDEELANAVHSLEEEGVASTFNDTVLWSGVLADRILDMREGDKQEGHGNG